MRIRKGMARVEAETDSQDIFATAFTGLNGRKTVVILNRSTSPHLIRIDGIDCDFTFVEVTDPYEENTLMDIPVKAGSRIPEITVAPGALVTLSNVPLGKLPEGFSCR